MEAGSSVVVGVARVLHLYGPGRNNSSNDKSNDIITIRKPPQEQGYNSLSLFQVGFGHLQTLRAPQSAET